MRYKNVVIGEFIDRPNRFIANVTVDGVVETVHVKNTGRCKEIFIPGVLVALERSDNPNRKTKYDLIAAKRDGVGWINIDSQAPNTVMKEYLESLDFDYIKPEYKYGKSRIDFYLEKGVDKYLIEVKGCTLFKDGIGYFPDAPTKRGVKHLEELARAARDGYHCAVAFVIGADGINLVYPNVETHPEYGEALERAKMEGVKVIYIKTHVTEDEFTAVVKHN